MKALLLSRYGSLGASSRVRYLQYLDDFTARGWRVQVCPLFPNAYLEALYARRTRWREAVKGYGGRLLALVQVRRFDVIILEKELFPFLPAGFEQLLARLNVRYVADYDDALFHRYDLHRRAPVRWLLGRKIDAVMRHAAIVVAGNDYLADRARKAGASRVEIIPTTVDVDRYRPAKSQAHGPPVVGWIGTPQTSRYLEPLLPVFQRLRRTMAARFVAVGARSEDFADTPLEIQGWSEETEVEAIQQFDIGIMPLDDSPWERGKCGYKLIQYMACGLPVVASPVGVNRHLVSNAENGYLADTPEGWYRCLAIMLQSAPEKRAIMGAEGRARVEARYSLQAQAPRLISAIEEAAR